MKCLSSSTQQRASVQHGRASRSVAVRAHGAGSHPLPSAARAEQQQPCIEERAQPLQSVALSRRDLALLAASLVPLWTTPSAQAVGFKKELKKRRLKPEDYTPNDDVGLAVYELEEGRGGSEVGLGDTVVVHFDCLYNGIDVVSSRSARLLGGNRTIAEPYEFVVGEPVLGNSARKISEGANGLFAGTGGPKPPQALSRAVLGMKKGGKRSILVDKPELGYPKGVQEIPQGATFELKVEVLEVLPKRA